MIVELVTRFIVGGLVVSAFAVIGDCLLPKNFAGIFGAAPSVALATLGMTLALHGGAYTADEGRSMIIGAIALLLYCILTAWVLLGRKLAALPTAGAAIGVWAVAAIGIWSVVLR